MQVDLLAQIIGQHKFDLDRSLLGEGVMACTCGQQWPDEGWSDAAWNEHVAQAILDALQPTTGPIDIDPGQVPLFDHEKEE